MLRHVRRHEVYWFCQRCWQEMPLLNPDRSLVTNLSFVENTILNRHRSLVAVGLQ